MSLSADDAPLGALVALLLGLAAVVAAFPADGETIGSDFFQAGIRQQVRALGVERRIVNVREQL
jgi:hypothetical protein